MSTTRMSSSGIIINVVEQGENLDDVFLFVAKNIESWTKNAVLWDMSCLDFKNLSPESIHRLIEKGAMISKKRDGLKTAIVAETDLGFGMMRMLQILAIGTLKFELNVFRNHEAALLWLEPNLIKTAN